MKFKEIPIKDIVPGDSMRENINPELSELSDSIEKYDIIQPILVTPLVAGKYKIISGHRRFAAMKQRNEFTIPCIIRSDFSRKDEVYISLVENIQRRELTPSEILSVYNKLKSEDKTFTQIKFAKLIGKSSTWVANQFKYVELYEILKDEGIPQSVLDSFSVNHLKQLWKVPKEDRVKVGKKASKAANGKEKSKILQKAISFNDVYKFGQSDDYSEFYDFVNKINPYVAGDTGLLITFDDKATREKFLRQVWDYRRTEILQIILPFWARDRLKRLIFLLDELLKEGEDEKLKLIKEEIVEIYDEGNKYLKKYKRDIVDRIKPYDKLVPKILDEAKA